MRVADELIDRIVNGSQIPSGKRRREIQRELRSHIEDFVAVARQGGRKEDEIESLLLSNFGDPGQIAQDFAWVYRHERAKLRVFAYVLSTVLLGGSLLAAVLATQAGLAVGFGTPIMDVVASRHTMIEAFDILTSVAAYLGLTSLESIFENRQLFKAASLLTAIFLILIVSSASAGLRTTFFLVYGLVCGTFFRVVQLFIGSKIARVAVVMVCFSSAGLFSALLRSSVSQVALAPTVASWLAIGMGYQLMAHLAAPVDTALLKGLQRIQAG